MYVISFSFHSKLVLVKAKKPASHELAIHTVFFSIFYIIFLKELWIFSNEQFDRLHSTNDQVLYSNYILLNSGFNFAFDLAFSYRNVSPPVCYLQ